MAVSCPRYAGTSGRTQGEMNEMTPAEKTVVDAVFTGGTTRSPAGGGATSGDDLVGDRP